MRKGTAITGTKQNEEKFKRLQKVRWEIPSSPSKLARCKMHNTYFDNTEEPCWQCYDECQEVIS